MRSIPTCKLLLLAAIFSIAHGYGNRQSSPSGVETTPDYEGNRDRGGGQWPGVGSGPDNFGPGPSGNRYPSSSTGQYGGGRYGKRSNFTQTNYVERYGSPEDCVLSKNFKESCEYYVEVSKHESYPDKVKALRFEVSRHFKTPTETGYVAVGLSKDQRMGEDHIVECTKNHRGQEVYHSWSRGQTRPERLKDDINVFKVDPPETPTNDRVLTCVFWRRVESDVHISDREPSVHFDLYNDKYFVLLARGPFKSELETDSLGYHGNDPVQKGEAYVSKTPLGYSNFKFRDFDYNGKQKYRSGGGLAQPAFVLFLLTLFVTVMKL